MVKLDQVLSMLKQQVTSLGQLCIQFDIWTSRNSKSYLGIIINWLDLNFNLQYYILGKLLLKDFNITLYIYIYIYININKYI